MSKRKTSGAVGVSFGNPPKRALFLGVHAEGRFTDPFDIDPEREFGIRRLRDDGSMDPVARCTHVLRRRILTPYDSSIAIAEARLIDGEGVLDAYRDDESALRDLWVAECEPREESDSLFVTVHTKPPEPLMYPMDAVGDAINGLLSTSGFAGARDAFWYEPPVPNTLMLGFSRNIKTPWGGADRKWFDEHPDCTWRIRPVIDGEEVTFPPGVGKPMLLVVEWDRWARVRTVRPIFGPKDLCAVKVAKRGRP
ncbi:MAG: hypothetical protein JNM61_05385 [Zoogloeaceae bacterium]|nr:hypothetical protein [Zoogloeaceae bacterium]